MATFPAIKPITAADVASLKEEKTFEVVSGEWVERPMAGELHGAIAANLILSLGSFIKTHKLGRIYPADTTFVLKGTPDNIQTMRLPDVSFVSVGRTKEADRAGYYYQAPDLAIEVVSPSERTVETQSKVNDYLRTGTREVWVVYPETQQVIVYHPDGTAAIYNVEQTIPGGELLPGFSLAVADIFDV